MTPKKTPPQPGFTQTAIVALIGRPNVGKSTLFNRITKSRKAIVDPTPGVTRDRQYERVEWEQKTFILVDTGGIEAEGITADAGDSMGGNIREQTLQAVAEADVLLFLMDGRDGVTPTDFDVTNLLRKADKPVYYIVNKIDGEELEASLLPPFYELGVEELWPISAEHGYGVRSLLDDLAAALPEREESLLQPADSIRIAFFGRPNVGKSSLINRLLGEERMVVSDIPGTTRDSIDTLLTVENKNYLLIDTAGIRRKGKVKEKLEKFSIIKALGALERCDLALILIDAEEGVTEQDTKVIGYTQEQGRACILVVNKWDLVKGQPKEQKKIVAELQMATQFVGFAPVLRLSALTGAGVKKLLPTITSVYEQFCKTFSTNRLNRILQDAVASHPPALHRGRRIKLLYTTQIASRPPTFAIVANYPKEIHFSYHRYLVNTFRKELGLDKTPIKIVFRERKRRKMNF
ncbi:MAG: GTP-binding protein Der [Desulfobacterales bacterium SG8_35]|nr:MAG: GTP-binding protein Der [Desulfobacterales bacterium SG8_35]